MKKTLLASALMLASAAATAADFKYTYGEIGYGELDDDGDALFFGGAVDLQQGFGIIGSYYAVDFDDDADGHIFTIGGQFHTPINKQLDFVASVQLINAEVEWDNCPRWADCSEDDTGLLLRGGLRFAIQHNLQLEGDISYNTNDFWEDDELGIKAGVRFFADRQLSLALGFASDQELDGLYFSGRYDFK
jgi:hypothetical protein